MHSTLSQLKDTLEQIPDPRSKQGVSHPFAGILALVLLGKIARKIYMSHIADWAEQHWHELKTPLGFDTDKPPKGGKLRSCEKRYFISSLDASVVSSERFLELVRGHWQIENRLHLIKDRWWDDDRHVLFRPGLGEVWSALTD